MLRKNIALVLGAILLLSVAEARMVFAGSNAAADAVAEVRAKVERIGLGEKARVEVRLRDGARVKGSVSRIGEQSFTVTEEKTGIAREVVYADVAQLNKRGGLSGSTKALIWGGVAVSAAIVLFVVRGAFCDGMCV